MPVNCNEVFSIHKSFCFIGIFNVLSGKLTVEELESSWYIKKAEGHYMLTSLFIVVKGFFAFKAITSVVYVGCTERNLSVSSNTMEFFLVYAKIGYHLFPFPIALLHGLDDGLHKLYHLATLKYLKI